MIELKYPGRRFLRLGESCVRRSQSFAIRITSERHRSRVLRILATLERTETALSATDAASLFFRSFRLFGLYFWASAGYTVVADGEDPERVLFLSPEGSGGSAQSGRSSTAPNE